MLKSILIASSILLSAASMADPLEASSDKDPAIAEKCKAGCLVLSPEDTAELVERVNGFAQQAYMAGLMEGEAAGAKEAFEALKSNPKLCPKNI